MCDPFFMFLLMNNLGKDYMVWDKGAKIDFVKPGEGTVTATFHLPDSEFTEIKTILQKEKKTIRTYEVEVVGEDGKTVAKISKDLYIRRLR